MGSGSTRYYHYFTQYADEVNGSYVPDPISTYSAMANAENSDIGDYVVNALQNGKGVNLRRYYQYSKLRYRNRYWDWELSSKAGNLTNKGLTNAHIIKGLGLTKPFQYIAQVNNEFVQTGAYVNYLVQQQFGIDEFNIYYQGKKFRPTNLKQTPQGITIMRNTEDNEPRNLYIPSMPERSKGVIYWDYSQEPKLLETKIEEVTYGFLDTPNKYPKKEGKTVLIKEWAEQYNPFGSSDNSSTDTNSYTEGELNQQQKDESDVIRVDERKFYRRYATVKQINKYQNAITSIVYEIKTETWEITYDTEHILYVTESGLTNSPQLVSLFEKKENPKQVPNGVITSSTQKNLFKLYPLLSLLDFGESPWDESWLVPELTDKHEIVQLQKIIDKALKDKTTNLDYKEAHEPNQVNSRLPAKDKKSDRKEGSKTYEYKGEQYTLRALQRKLQRLLNMHRKIKMGELKFPAKVLSKGALKRHTEKCAELLGVDYMAQATSLVADENFRNGSNGIMERNFIPAVKFSSDLLEVQGYWYHLFDHLYDMYDKEQDYLNWITAINNAQSFNDIPIKTFTFRNQSNLDYGGMAWLFINKFEIDGNLRKIRRIRRYKEIKRGKPIKINSIDELKQIIEPPRELAQDFYHTSKNGVEHCIGGDDFYDINPNRPNYKPDLSRTGVMEEGINMRSIMNKYNYTFFCKQKGKGKLEVIAVAGLCFTTKMVQRVRWAHAWYDLHLQYARNRNNYIDKNPEFSATYDTQKRMNKRHYYINKISHFGIVPVDYNVIRRISAVELERLSIRVPLMYGFTHSEVKGKAKWVKKVITVVQVIITIIGIVLSFWSGGTSNAAAQGANAALQVYLQAALQAIVTAVVVQLAVKYVVLPLIKALGLKGIVALIVMVIIAIVASMFTGQPVDSQSVLPYASEVGKQTATQIANEVAAQTTTETVLNTLKETVTQAVTSMFKDGFTMAKNFMDMSIQGMNQYQQEQAQSIRSSMIAEQKAYLEASDMLRQQQEELQKYAPNFDVKQVLGALRTRFKMYDPNNFINSNTVPDEYSASYAYLENFINMKLDLNPLTFDPVRSLDFSFNNTANNTFV